MTTATPERLELHEGAKVFSEVVATTENANVFRVRIISSGAGSSSYYPAPVLERDGPSVFVAGTKAFANHSSFDEMWNRPERSILDIVGKQVSEAVWEPDAPEGEGLYANYEYKADFIESVIKPFGDVIGVSISAFGDVVRDEFGDEAIKTIGDYTGTVIERLYPDPFTSVDVVTVPGRDGRIIERLTEAMKPFSEHKRPAEPRQTNEKEKSVDEEKIGQVIDAKLEAFAETLLAKINPAPVVSEEPDMGAVTEAAVKAEIPEDGRERVRESVKSGVSPEDAIAREKKYVESIEAAVKAKIEESFRQAPGVTGGLSRVSEAKTASDLVPSGW
jgi:hypothetical protein